MDEQRYRFGVGVLVVALWSLRDLDHVLRRGTKFFSSALSGHY